MKDFISSLPEIDALRAELENIKARADDVASRYGVTDPSIGELQSKLSAQMEAVADIEKKHSASLADIQKTVQAAQEEARAEWKKRAETIMELAEESGGSRKLIDLAANAIREGVSVADFRDQLFEFHMAQPTSKPLHLASGASHDSENIDALRARLSKTADPQAKRILVKRIKELRNQ